MGPSKVVLLPLVLIAIPSVATAQIQRYDVEFNGEFCFMCHVGEGTGQGVPDRINVELTNIEIDAAGGRATVVVPPDREVAPEDVEAMIGALGYSVRRMEVVVAGVAESGDSGWRFVAGGEIYPLDVPESHLVHNDLAAAGSDRQQIRAEIRRDPHGWHLFLLDLQTDGMHRTPP